LISEVYIERRIKAHYDMWAQFETGIALPARTYGTSDGTD
jgi:hypothetical protein